MIIIKSIFIINIFGLSIISFAIVYMNFGDVYKHCKKNFTIAHHFIPFKHCNHSNILHNSMLTL